MAVADIISGRDLILGVFKTVWAASSYSAVPVHYPDVKNDVPRTGSWVRVTLQHNGERQQTLGEVGNRRFKRWGILTFQVYTEHGDGQTVNDAMVKVIHGAYRGKTTGVDGVWFHGARIAEAGIDGEFWQTNVMVDFEYEEIA